MKEKSALLISLTNLGKTYGGGRLAQWLGEEGKTVFQNLNLEFHLGECVGLMGYSGEGKTTLTRLMMGLEAPSTGTITIEGMSPAAWQTAHSGDFAAVFQDSSSALNPDLTLEGALLGSLRLKGRREDEHARMGGMLRALGLSEKLLTAFPHELSGGQCQRVAIARALLSEARITFFDEALSALDALHQNTVLRYLKEAKPQESLWFFVSHDLEAVVTLCDRVIVLGEGGILADGNPESLLRSGNAALRTLIKRCYWE